MVGGVAGGTYGGVFTQTDAAVAVGNASGYSKVGTAESTAIIFFATGDSSIKAAMENGHITKIHHVDCKVMSVLGLYAKYTTVVYGE
jgi:phosphatidylserine decarboxylase